MNRLITNMIKCIHTNTMIVDDFKTPLMAIGVWSRQKISTETQIQCVIGPDVFRYT